MVTPEIPGATRRAALHLHSLSAEQRRQVMARLRPGDVAKLQPLLAELTQLGIPSDLARDIDAEPQREPVSPRGLTAVDKVSRLNVDEVVYALTPCAPATAGALLRSAEWPWKAEVLDRLDPLGRATVLREMAAELPPLGASALLAMCEQVCLRLSERDSVRPFASQATRGPMEDIRVEATGLRANPWPPARPHFGARLRRLLKWNR